jgi:hypothetical protein
MKARTIYVDDVATTTTSYYTVPANNRAKIVFLILQHDTGSGSKDVQVLVNDGTTDNHLMHAKGLSIGDEQNLNVSQTSYVMMEAGYVVKAVATDTGMQMIMTVEETPFLVSTA